MDSNPVTAPVQPRLRSASMSAPLSGVQTSKPLFVRVEVYQKILGEIDSLRDDLKELNHFNGSLENSEYNEETNFVKLKKGVKVMHDRLLQVDKIIFKA